MPSLSDITSYLDAQLGIPGTPDYATAAMRLKNRDALNAEIDKILAVRSSADWVAAMPRAHAIF